MENSESQSARQHQIIIENQQSWVDTFHNDKNLKAMNERLVLFHQRMTPTIILSPNGEYNFVMSNISIQEELEMKVLIETREHYIKTYYPIDFTNTIPK